MSMQKLELTPELRIELLTKILHETKMRLLDLEVAHRELNRKKLSGKSENALVMINNAIHNVEAEHTTLLDKLDVVNEELLAAHKL